MQALVLPEPGRAVLAQIPDPIPQPGEALLRVRRVGLCGSDLNSFRGLNPLVTYPRVPGHEIAATILSLPAAMPETLARNLSVGMDVTLSPYTHCGHCSACLAGRTNACQFNQTLGVQREGALAELVAIPVERLFPATLANPSLTLEELVLVEPLTVGFHAVARAQVTASDSVLILGAGGVGLGAVAAAAMRGATVLAVDRNPDRLAVARQAGATHTLVPDADPAAPAAQALAEQIRSLTGGRGPSVVIEAIGTPETFRAAVELVAFAGRVVYIGYAKQPVSYETRLFVQKELDIRGSRNALPEDFRAVIAMLAQRRFPLQAAIGCIVPLSQAPAIFERWQQDPGAFTKIVLTLDDCQATR